MMKKAKNFTQSDTFWPVVTSLALMVALLLLLVFARGTGLRAILSFIDTILLMWKVLVPSLLNGYNPVWVSLCLVMVLTALILMLIYGWDRRFLAAVSGAALGILVTVVLGAVFTDLFQIHGAVTVPSIPRTQRLPVRPQPPYLKPSEVNRSCLDRGNVLVYR